MNTHHVRASNGSRTDRYPPLRDFTQTAEMLAQDALALVDGVWGEAQRFHIYGASMGMFSPRSPK